MFKEVFIVQCTSTGEFLTHLCNTTKNFSRVGYLPDRQSAVDTGLNELDNDFKVHSFYKKESELPSYCGGEGLASDPHSNTGGYKQISSKGGY